MKEYVYYCEYLDVIIVFNKKRKRYTESIGDGAYFAFYFIFEYIGVL